MNAPILSTFTLFTELLITVAVIYIFYKSIKTSMFPAKLAFITLAYEILFNISYMVYSSVKRESVEMTREFTWKTGVAIFHGIVSLIMFIALVIFMLVAYRAYKQNRNFFRENLTLSYIFLFFWFVAIISGIVMYLTHFAA